MRQKVKIIPAVDADIPVLAAIAQQAFPDPWSEVVFSQALHHPDSCIWCAVAGADICGYLVLSRAGENISVDDIAVRFDFRRQGIARQLLEQAHSYFPHAEFWLEVRASNAAAIALYIALGYVQVGLRKRYYRAPVEDAILMTRPISIS